MIRKIIVIVIKSIAPYDRNVGRRMVTALSIGHFGKSMSLWVGLKYLAKLAKISKTIFLSHLATEKT